MSERAHMERFQFSLTVLLFVVVGLCVYVGILAATAKALGIPPGQQGVLVINELPLILVWSLGTCLFWQHWRQGRRAAAAGLLGCILLVAVNCYRSLLAIWTMSLMRGGTGAGGPNAFNIFSTSSAYLVPMIQAVAWCLILWAYTDRTSTPDPTTRKRLHWSIYAGAGTCIMASGILAYMSVSRLF